MTRSAMFSKVATLRGHGGRGEVNAGRGQGRRRELSALWHGRARGWRPLAQALARRNGALSASSADPCCSAGSDNARRHDQDRRRFRAAGRDLAASPTGSPTASCSDHAADHQDSLEATGLVQPGSLITWRYRLKLRGSIRLPVTAAVSRSSRLSRCRLAIADPQQCRARCGPFRRAAGVFPDAGRSGRADRRRRRHRQRGQAFINRRPAQSPRSNALAHPGHRLLASISPNMLLAPAAILIGLLAGAMVPPVARAVRRCPAIAGLRRHRGGRRLPSPPLGFLALAFAVWPLAHPPRSASCCSGIAPSYSQGRIPRPWFDRREPSALIAAAFLNFEIMLDDRFPICRAPRRSFRRSSRLGLALLIVVMRRARRSQPSPILRYAIANLYRPGPPLPRSSCPLAWD